MSYDLMVFDANIAPRDRTAFIAWYKKQAEWSESHSYNDPKVTTSELQGLYSAVRREFPNMNGPDAASDEEIDRSADYSIGKSVIYGAFPWSRAEVAYDVVRRRAVDFGVGFYDVSGDEGDGEIHFPGEPLRAPSGGNWREVAKQFRDLKDNK